MNGQVHRLVHAAMFLSIVAGCRSSTMPRSADQTRSEAQRPTSTINEGPPTLSTGTGSVSGVVKLEGKMPARVNIDMTMDPVCEMKGGENRSEQYVGKDGRLANVFVYVEGGPPPAMSTPNTQTTPVVLDQRGCRYTPHVIGVRQGYAAGPLQQPSLDECLHQRISDALLCRF